MTGMGRIGGKDWPNPWVPAGVVYEVNYGYRCDICSDTGMQLDNNGEPECCCDCVFGEALLMSLTRSPS